MSAFWQSGTGNEITGDPKSAFLQDFTVIPDGTLAVAVIDKFELVEKSDQYGEKKYYEIMWKITSPDFKGRVVSQKIKPFDGKPEAIDRNLNMMKLVMTLCQYKPTHANAPSTDDLRPMIGKSAGIKIREWSMPKQDGSGMMEGNFVAEVHPAQGFQCEVGEKLEVIYTPSTGVDSALSRNPRGQTQVDLTDDIPF